MPMNLFSRARIVFPEIYNGQNSLHNYSTRSERDFEAMRTVGRVTREAETYIFARIYPTMRPFSSSAT